MELVFLGVLILLMIIALSSGYPVAFALPGAAIAAIGLAALTGYVLEGNPDAYFIGGDGPLQWLSAGVTNLRSLYWMPDRDTLIAIPLFIFMGIMLQRSMIAEDLLVAMARLFGPLPGGLGISVVIVGALLAATTGIVGATVVAMGLISLPAMMRNNYSKSLATGTICASGTLGQIIPPSIVLIILADQLSSAADQANTIRKDLYRTVTGEFSMPSQYEVVSASAGDMFMGAILPGLVLVGIYILYILLVAFLKPEKAPPVPYEGKYDAAFFRSIFVALVPPLALILVVLGSILLGIATVNQAGSIGALGAVVMAGYRLHQGPKFTTFLPTFITLAALVALAFILSRYDINIRKIETEEQRQAVQYALIAVGFLVFALLWSLWRVYRTHQVLKEVMLETAKTTSMVFIILIGAAMLTAAFRAFGGEELVKHALTSLPGGFWTQFLVVMLVIFLLGFFLDFIEIAVVVVPIVAPILLMNPEANVTAVWLGVMIGLNLQTSFLTPPFGFALFYLRGVADATIKTLDIYKGASAFIILQLIGLGIAGAFPSLINYMPNRSFLLSENAPPPINPRLQVCLYEYVTEAVDDNADSLKRSIQTMQQQNVSFLPEPFQAQLKASEAGFTEGFERMAATQAVQAELDQFAASYAPLHRQVRTTQTEMAKQDTLIKQTQTERNNLAYSDVNEASKAAKQAQYDATIQAAEAQKTALQASIPAEWEAQHSQYTQLNEQVAKAQREYYSEVDGAYEKLREVVQTIQATDNLMAQEASLTSLVQTLPQQPVEMSIAAIESVEKTLETIAGTGEIRSDLAKARRSLKKATDTEALQKAVTQVQQAQEQLRTDLTWRKQAQIELLPALEAYYATVTPVFGIRSQTRLDNDQAKSIAACLSHHRNIALNF